MPLVLLFLFILFIVHYFISLAATIPFKLLCISFFYKKLEIYIISFILNIIFCFILSIFVVFTKSEILIVFVPVFIIFEYFIYRIIFFKGKKTKIFLFTIFINVIPIGIMNLIYHIKNFTINDAVAFPVKEYGCSLLVLFLISYFINKYSKKRDGLFPDKHNSAG